MTPDKLVEELDRTVKVPGLSNIWVPPIRNRIDMLATGIKSPVGVKVAGATSRRSIASRREIERVVKAVPGVTSALAERLTGGRYIDVKIDRDAAARYGLNIADVQSVVSAAIGGENIGETVEGLQRFPINVRYPRELRDSVEKIRDLPVLTERGAQIRLARRGGDPHHATARRCCGARTRGCRAGSTSICAGATCARRCARCSSAVAQEREAAGRLFDLVVGPVRVSGARDARS